MVFETVVCGIDPGPESMDAANQAARLVAPGGRLLLLSIVETDVAVHAGWAAADVIAQLEKDSAEALDRATRALSPVRAVESRLLEGPTVGRFLDVLETEGATLAVVGTHGHSRAGGILLGGLSSSLLHDARCSVLVARPVTDIERFPARILVGTDGSNEGATACAIAGALRDRFGGEMTVVAATGGKATDLASLRASYPDAVVDERKPVAALVARSTEADLLVIGSRGLHGLRALGSVSERVAHEARCSVLVVR